MEQMLTKSHRYLSNGIYLIKHVKNSIQFLPEIAHQTKLLLYVSNLYEAMVKFTFTFFGYKAQRETNKSLKNIPQEIDNLCSLIMDILRITKIRLHVMLLQNAEAQGTIERIFPKVQLKLQRYLISINYFNKLMIAKCKVE